MINLRKSFGMVLISVIGAYAGVSFLVTKDLNPLHWGASFRNKIAIIDARNGKLEEIAEENLRLYNQVLRKAEMHDSKIGLSWYDKARLSQDLGVEQVINEDSRIDFRPFYKSFRLKISITDSSQDHTHAEYVISKETLSGYLNK